MRETNNASAISGNKSHSANTANTVSSYRPKLKSQFFNPPLNML